MGPPNRHAEPLPPAGAVLWYLMVLGAAAGLYILTCAPTILWQDSGLFVYRIWHNDLEGNLGLALAHPLYIMLGIAVKRLPFADLAYKVNLMSAIFGAITVANLFLLLRLWTGRLMPAILGAVTLAVSWNFWQHAVIAEVYTLYTAQMLTELLVLYAYLKTRKLRLLYLLALLNGLAAANHMWAIFGLACYAVILAILARRGKIGLKHLAAFAFCWVLGAAPYEYLIIKNILLSGDITATLRSAAFGNIWQQRVLNTSVSPQIVLENGIFIALNFPTPNFALLFAGLWALRKTELRGGFAHAVLALAAIYFLFAFRYTVPDRYVFFLPFYCFASAFIGIGADVLLRHCRRRWLAAGLLACALLPVAVYTVTPQFARKHWKTLGERRQRLYRDEYTYFLQPWKTGYRGAEQFAREALSTVEENALIYAYTTDVHTLLYLQQVKHLRPDVAIVSDYDCSEHAPPLCEKTIEKLLARRAVYVVSPVAGYCPKFLLDRYRFTQAGVLWKVAE